MCERGWDDESVGKMWFEFDNLRHQNKVFRLFPLFAKVLFRNYRLQLDSTTSQVQYQLHAGSFFFVMFPKSTRQGIPARIPCTHPACPVTFLSRRGLTNHVRTMHRDTHTVHCPSRTPTPTSPLPNSMDIDEPDILRHTPPHSPPSPTHESSKAGKKIYHPFLNGIVQIYYKGEILTNVSYQGSLVMLMGIIYHQAQILRYTQMLPMTTGHRMRMRSSSGLRNSFSAMLKCHRRISTIFWSYGACR